MLSTVDSKGSSDGPGSRVSFKEIPVGNLAEASNTTLSFVVVLDFLTTHTMHKQVNMASGFLL